MPDILTLDVRETEFLDVLASIFIWAAFFATALLWGKIVWSATSDDKLSVRDLLRATLLISTVYATALLAHWFDGEFETQRQQAIVFWLLITINLSIPSWVKVLFTTEEKSA